MSDNMAGVWQSFSKQRTDGLFNRFPGWYRALVVETNDPLQMHRIRFKCPELHNFNLSATQCPWAVTAPSMGGKNTGSWAHPIINDIIWVTWEKNHPYGPIWCGFADGTRRKRYPLESIFTRSPLSVNEDGEPDNTPPDDFLEEYLPKDFRPMSHGWSDRYGNFEVNKSVGFFPKEHELAPSPVGMDAVSQSEFEIGDKPEVNDPDQKYLVRCTKYGGFFIMSDVGYDWFKEDEFGEFIGNDEEDRDFEVARSKFLTRLFSNDSPTGSDQRRIEARSRAGHKFEMRDVGWAQKAGSVSGDEVLTEPTKTRGEYDGNKRVVSKNEFTDERWIKLRTKGGHLLQFMDTGFHPEEDESYKRSLIDDNEADDEINEGWTKRDARQVRLVSRHGFKLALDDRGSDPREADTNNELKGNGFLLKTRRGFEQEEPRGFGFEANDKDDLNTTRWYTPKSKIIELNDAKDYIAIATDTASEISRPWAKLAENEFALKIAMTEDPEEDTHHLKLDKLNGYVRLKTSGGKDNGRRPVDDPDIDFPDIDTGLNQGLEARDGRTGDDGPWVEVVDIEGRGMWLSKNEKLGVWRSSDAKNIFVMIRDDDNSIFISNNESTGKVQIFSSGNIEFISDGDIAMVAQNNVSIKSLTGQVILEANGGQAVLDSAEFGTNRNFVAPQVRGRLPGAFPGNGAPNQAGSKSGSSLNPQKISVDKVSPGDRGAVKGSFDEVSEKIITGQDPVEIIIGNGDGDEPGGPLIDDGDDDFELIIGDGDGDEPGGPLIGDDA